MTKAEAHLISEKTIKPKKIKQPNAIQTRNSRHELKTFTAYSFGLEDAEKLHEWLGRVIQWKKQQ